LDQIVRTKRSEVEAAKRSRPLTDLHDTIGATAPPRDFLATVTEKPTWRVNLIAEVKKASPSAGVIVPNFDPVAIARNYAQSGASALSVLTDETYFSGRLAHISQIKQVVDLPVLRKEFIIDEYQIVESRAAGADAILLISEILSPDEIQRFHAAALQLELAVLIEGHSAESLIAVVERLGPPGGNRYLLGINNRDLHAQQTDVGTTVRIARALPAGTPFVSESGLHTRQDVETVASAGACAILVGESLLRARNIGKMIRTLLGTGTR
jgi:indole-3-glycerol phosphate synthase